MFGSSGGGFGSSNTGFGTSKPFGGNNTQQQTTPAFGSTGSTFGSGSTGAFAPKPAFGTGSTATGFGSTTTSAFGPKPNMFGPPTTSTTSAFGSPAPGTSGFGRTTSTSPFGATPAPATGVFGLTAGVFGTAAAPASPFGAPAPAGGLGGFGSTASNPFGKPSSSPFGAPTQAAPTTGSVFGAPTPAPTAGVFGGFGSTSTTGSGLFGSTPAPATGAFGTTAPAAGGGLFGSTTPATSLGAFGAGTSVFGASTQKGTGNPSWRETRADDPTGKSAGNLMSISAMKEYEGKSHEELRVEDYLQNRKNSSAVSTASKGFGTTPAQSTGLFGGFGSTPSAAPAGGGFSFGSLSTSATPAPSTFGGGFGSSTTPAPAAGGFAGFGATPAPAPSTGLFGAPAPATTNAFGAPAPAPSGSFSFGATAPAPSGGFSGLFGSSSASPSPAPGTFGAPAPAAGTFTFGGGFGSTGATPAPAPSGFGSSIGAFGAPAPAPATGTGFSFGASTTPAFGAPAPAPAGGGFGTVGGGSLFGATSASTTPAAGLFSFNKTAGTPAPSTTPGAFAFGSTPKPAGTGAFGAPAPSGGMFGSTAPAPSAGAFSFGGTAPAPAAGGFGSFGSTFGSSASAPAPGSVFGAPATGNLFGAGSTAPASGGGFGSAPTQQQQQQRVAVHNQDPYGTAGNAGFGSGALEQKIKGVENSSQQLSIRFERGGHTSGIGASDQGGSNFSGQASPSLGFAYRRTPRSSTHIQPRGLGGAKSGFGGGQGGSSSSSAILPLASSSRLLSEGVLTPSGKSGVRSPDAYLTGGMKRISYLSGVVEDDAGQRSITRTATRTVKLLEEDEETVDGVQDGQQRLATEEGGGAGGVEETKGEEHAAGASAGSASKTTRKDSKGEGKIDGKEERVAATSPQGDSRRREARAGGGVSGGGFLPEASPHPSSAGKTTDVRAAAIGAGDEGALEASPPGNGERLFTEGSRDNVFGSGPATQNADEDGYETMPPMSELATMGDDELRAVSGFEVIRGGYGRIAWKEPVDLRGVDIRKVVKIEYKSASVYDELPEGQEKPALGKGLNRPAVVTLCGLFPKYENPTDEQNRRYEEKVRKNTGRMGAKFVSYDCMSGIWVFETFHWSRYAMDDSEDEEDHDDRGTKARAKAKEMKEMPPPPSRNPAAVRSRRPTPNKGHRRQSGVAATRGGTKYYMPDTDEESSVADNASDNDRPVSRGGGGDREEKAGPDEWYASVEDADPNNARSNTRGGSGDGGHDTSAASRIAAETDCFLSSREPPKQEYLRFHLLDAKTNAPSPRGRKEGDRVRDLSSPSSTKSSPTVPQPSPLPRRPPPPPQRRALRNPEDAEAAKNFRPVVADPESQVLRLLANAWETAPGEPKHEAARGTVRAGRIVADLGLRLGRGFRASWGPGGVLVCPGSVGGGDAPGKYAVRMKRLNPTPVAFGRDMESLYVGSLRNHLRFAEPRLDGCNVPRWELPRRRNDKPDNYADLVKCMHGYAAVHAAAGAQCSHSSGGAYRGGGTRAGSGGNSSEDGPEWVLEQAWRLASAMWGQEEGEGRTQDLPVPGDVHTAAPGFGSVGESDEASPAARREAAVADWLANAVASCVPAGEWSAAAASAEAGEEGRGAWRRILELLSVRRVENAAEVAMNAGLPRLAVALSAAATQGIGRPVRNDASRFLAHQATLWQGNGSNACMPQEAFIVYQLLGREGFRDVRLRGVIGKGSDSLHPSLDWLRQLGLCLWFGAGAPLGDGGGAVADAVKAYESLVTDKEAIPPTARYFQEPTHHDKADLDQVCRELRRVHLEVDRKEFCGVVAETGTGRDRCVLNRLLAMYPSQTTGGGGGGASGVALLSALEPMAVTPDVMDYRHSWHLMKVAEALGVAEVPDRLKVAAIAEGMRFQLECAGLWEWAVYVALTIEGDVDRREATAREIVVRHGFGLLGDSLSPKDEERRRLLHELHTPVSWLNEADATRAGYEQQSALPTPAPCEREDILATVAAGAKAEQARETKLKHLISAASVELGGDMASEACALAPGSLYLGGSARRRLAECFEKIDRQLKGRAQGRAFFHPREGSVGLSLSIDAVGGDPRTKEFDAYKEIIEAAEGAASGLVMGWTEEKVERLARMRSVVEPAATRILGRAAACEALSSVWDEAEVLVA